MPWHGHGMRPAIKPGLLVVWRDRDTLQIGIDPRRAVALTGMGRAAGLIGLLDGSREHSQVLAAAEELGIPRDAADQVIGLLAAAGAVQDFPAAELRALPDGPRARLARELATVSLAHGHTDGGARALARRQAATRAGVRRGPGRGGDRQPADRVRRGPRGVHRAGGAASGAAHRAQPATDPAWRHTAGRRPASQPAQYRGRPRNHGLGRPPGSGRPDRHRPSGARLGRRRRGPSRDRGGLIRRGLIRGGLIPAAAGSGRADRWVPGRVTGRAGGQRGAAPGGIGPGGDRCGRPAGGAPAVRLPELRGTGPERPRSGLAVHPGSAAGQAAQPVACAATLATAVAAQAVSQVLSVSRPGSAGRGRDQRHVGARSTGLAVAAA